MTERLTDDQIAEFERWIEKQGFLRRTNCTILLDAYRSERSRADAAEAALVEARANAIPEDARERIALLLRERSPVPRAYRGGVSAWYPEADAVLAALRRPA